MASDHPEHENENEQENTEQIGDLQQIENLKIQVRWWNTAILMADLYIL